jgi:phage repressor protein C with HTH and peptisase S24 domain
MEDETLSDRIRRLINKDTPTAFARRAGLKEATLRSILKGTRPSIDIAISIAEAAGVSVDWLATGQGPMRKNELAANAEVAAIPVLDHRASAGHGQWTQDTDTVIDHLFMPMLLLRELGIPPQDCVLLRADGHSMEPTVPDGAFLMVLKGFRQFRDGYIYIIRWHGELMVKRIRFYLPKGYEVYSDNPDFPRFLITHDELEALEIIGRVVWFGRDI